MNSLVTFPQSHSVVYRTTYGISMCDLSEKETGIGRDDSSPIAAIGVLSLGLFLPLSVGPLTNRAVAVLVSTVATPAKHIVLVRDGQRDALETHATNVADFLAEQHVTVTPEDRVEPDASATIVDGATVRYRPARALTLVVDGAPRAVRTVAATVREALQSSGVRFDQHDQLSHAPNAPVLADDTIVLEHRTSWQETARIALRPLTKTVVTADLPAGHARVIDPGRTGIKEVSYQVTRTNERATTRRTLAARIVRQPRARIIARGIAEYTAVADLAERGFVRTLRLANSALSMVATAYTAGCAGCSGTTASGDLARYGIVAVDPRVIPLGTKLYISGYGHATAGDTGGAIRGNRIDLGMQSASDAMRFGRRNVRVYVLAK